MGTNIGPKIVKAALDFALDSSSNTRGYTKYGTSGANNSNRAAINFATKGTIDISTTSNLINSGTHYTLYGLTYPEGSQTPASRDGITPGFNNTSATKTYNCSRDLNYFVFNEDTNTWVPDSYFNGERISGHSYDTYDGQPNQHATFQADFEIIKNEFPNGTHIIIGSHAAENFDSDANTLQILQSLGLPSSDIGVDRPEFILIGKLGKPWTQHYVRENVSSAVAHLNVLLPLEGQGGDLDFDGTDDYLITNLYSGRNPSSEPFTVEAIVKADTTGTNMMWVDVDGNGTNQRFYSSLFTAARPGNFGTQASAWSHGTAEDTNYHHQVIVMDGTTARVYDNGVQVGTRSYTSYTLPSNIRVGSRSGTSYHWNGVIPVFKIYDAALTAAEVKQNFNVYKNRFGI